MSGSHSIPAERPYLSVILPAYNEVKRIAETLSLMRHYLDGRGWDYEIIVSADGDDGTREKAIEVSANEPGWAGKLVVIGTRERGGKGKGIRNGVRIARGRFVGFVDADYKTPIDAIDQLLPDLEKGCHVVIGSRAQRDSRIIRPQPLYRRVGSKAFKWVMRMILGLYGIGDTQCGFKFFQASVARDLFARQRIDGYMFDVEILRLARRLGYRIKEIGVPWQDDADSRYDPIGGTWRNAKELLRIRFMRYPQIAPAMAEPSADSLVAGPQAGVRKSVVSGT